MKRSLLCLLAVVFCLSSYAQKTVIDKVVATVGNELILLSDIEEQHALLEAQQGVAPADAKCLIVDNMMGQMLLLNQAKLDSIDVSEEEVEAQLTARIERILAYMNNDISQFEAYYGQSVEAVKSEFRQDLRNQILADRKRMEIQTGVSVTPAEVKDFFNRIPKDSLPYFNAEVEVGEIVINPKVNKEQLGIAREALADIRQRIVAGESFEELAIIYSDDPGSGKAGGDLGWQKRGTFVPAFEAAAYNLENGGMSDLIETEFGYHLIQLIERRGNAVHARHILVKPKITYADTEKAQNKLDSIRLLVMNDSLSFNEAVKKYSDEDAQSYNNGGRMLNQNTGDTYFQIGDLDPKIYFAIDTMKVNQVSAPLAFTDFGGEESFRIVQLQARTAPHKANLKDDYAKIQAAALEEKRTGFINEWITNKMGSTFVRIDDIYNSCSNLDKWKASKKTY